MVNEEPIVRPSDMLLALALGTAAVLAMLPPWFGLGWGVWFAWLSCATIGLVIAVRCIWLR
ncbi:MAG TPA: hypothetical protein VHB98_00620 [Chloroflexota bacterium]|jgi:hypothetical protein|nr:hypothetical protein [Chloroflexota bacterium]